MQNRRSACKARKQKFKSKIKVKQRDFGQEVGEVG